MKNRNPFSNSATPRIWATLAVLLLPVTICQAQWVQSKDLDGGSVNALLVNGPNFIAGSQGGYANIFAGVFLSADSGRTWKHISIGISYFPFYTLGASGNYLFGGFESGIMRSQDNGESWMQVKSGLHGGRFAVSGSNIYSATNNGVYRSSDNGDNWTQTNNGIPTENTIALLVNGATIFAATDTGLFISSNNGDDWTRVNNGASDGYYMCLGKSGTRLFAGTREHGLFRSLDSGVTWVQIKQGLTNEYISAFADHENRLFVGTVHGVFQSSDNGDSWTEVNSGFYEPAIPMVQALVAIGGNLFAGTYGSGLWMRPLSEIIPVSLSPHNISGSSGFSGIRGSLLRLGESIEIRVDRPGMVDLGIYDTKGARVSTLLHTRMSSGNHRVALGQDVLSTGLYFLRFVSDGITRSQAFLAEK